MRLCVVGYLITGTRRERKGATVGACQIFCVERGYEIIRKGLFHD